MITKTKLFTTLASLDTSIDDIVNEFIATNKDISVKNITFQAVLEGTVNGEKVTKHYAFLTYEAKDEKASRKVGF